MGFILTFYSGCGMLSAMGKLKGYAGVCTQCSAPHIHYGDIPEVCISCGGNVKLHGQITKLGILLPGLYHAVQDRRNFKRTNWGIYNSISRIPVGQVTNLILLKQLTNTSALAGVHPSYSGNNLIEFIDDDRVSIRWFILNHPVDLEEI